MAYAAATVVTILLLLLLTAAPNPADPLLPDTAVPFAEHHERTTP